MESVSIWTNADRNDFCRFLHIVRSAWNALPTLIKLPSAPVPKTSIEEDVDIPELLFPSLEINAGCVQCDSYLVTKLNVSRFTLTAPSDPRYQAALKHRTRFGVLLHKASITLRRTDTADHIDAVIQVCKGIDVYLLEYAITRSTYSATAKAYQSRREWVVCDAPF